MSPSLPPVISSTANASVYAAAIHFTAARLACMWRWIVGSAIVRIVESAKSITNASATTATASLRARAL